jgi:hypothetical protein
MIWWVRLPGDQESTNSRISVSIAGLSTVDFGGNSMVGFMLRMYYKGNY